MVDSDARFKEWESFWQRIDSFRNAVSRNAAQNVNSARLRNQARAIGQDYFRDVKKTLSRRGVTEASTAELENDLRRLVGLANGRNSKISYQNVLREIGSRRGPIETGLEFLIGIESPASFRLTEAENAIIATLDGMIPTAAGSYRQVLIDLQQKNRISHRGTAAELREVVREVLDKLAPDAEVTKAPGFKLEKDRTGPTMAQRVRFILSARESTDPARATAENAADIIDQSVAKLGRSVYTRGAMNVHTSRALQEIRNFKMYADAILAELLEIHKPTEAGHENE